MAGFICSEGFLKGFQMYLWRNPYNEFTYIYGGIHMKVEIHIRSSHVSMARFICKEGYI